MTEKTMGVFIFNTEGKLLVCHPNEMSDIWGIPKGRPDEGEESKETTVREVYEETGIRFNTEDIEYIGSERYSHKDKMLVGFILKHPCTVPTKFLKCRSKFRSRRSGNMIPEIDAYKWVSFHDYKHKIQSEQVRLLELYLTE
jgi:8-oxo-dGTP pyrophosphatase MutT (NUDIX family)